MATLLNDTEIDDRLQALGRWRREGDSIVCELELADFAAAVGFIERVAAAAEAANHHPDMLVHDYKRVRLSLSTHSAGGLTESDFALATTIEGLGER